MNELTKRAFAQIDGILDSMDILEYSISPIEIMAGSFVVIFPIGAQMNPIHTLQTLQDIFLRSWNCVSFSINGNNLVLTLI